MKNKVVSVKICISEIPSEDGQVLITWVKNGQEESRYFHKNAIGEEITLVTCTAFLRENGFLPPLQWR